MLYGPDPLETMTDLRRRLYRVLEASAPTGPLEPAPYSPPLDIVHDAEGVVITVELPGVRREEVKVELKGELLTIRGERKAEAVLQAAHVLRRERPSGAFARSLHLSGVHDRQITANLQDGVLVVKVTRASGEGGVG
jgi:HSP20 family protein